MSFEQCALYCAGNMELVKDAYAGPKRHLDRW